MKRKSNAELGAMALGEGTGKRSAKKKAGKKRKTCGSMGELVLAVATIKKAQGIITNGGIKVTSKVAKAKKSAPKKKTAPKKKRAKKSKKKSSV